MVKVHVRLAKTKVLLKIYIVIANSSILVMNVLRLIFSKY